MKVEPLKTLYVRRQLLNAVDVVSWARGQGFADLKPARQLHVTIAFSRRRLNWQLIKEPPSEISIGPSDNRRVTRLPPDAVALEFQSAKLVARHTAIVELGASWDYAEYRPHVTFCYGGFVDVTTVVPYEGPLEFGAEIWRQTRDGRGYRT